MKVPCMAIWDLEQELKKGSILIDMREKAEYEQAHIPGAVWMEGDCVVDNILGEGKEKTYILYCERGNRSLQAACRLVKEEYSVFSIVGGFEAYRAYKD